MNVFEEVKERLTLRQVVEYYGCKVDRKGWFICPFHPDTHPSCSINPYKDYFNCFVCDAGGDLITFTARLFGLKNYDACKKLNEDFSLGLDIEGQEKKDLFEIDRQKRKRLQEKRERENLEKLILHTGLVLAKYHAYLWQGKQLYRENPKRLERAFIYLSQAEYMLEEYDKEPEQFSRKNIGEVRRIEKRVRCWDNEV
ncbi:MAG: CHC2 zinc finger domain-containing protein [Lachnospiraceae bacterium]